MYKAAANFCQNSVKVLVQLCDGIQGYVSPCPTSIPKFPHPVML